MVLRMSMLSNKRVSRLLQGKIVRDSRGLMAPTKYMLVCGGAKLSGSTNDSQP